MSTKDLYDFTARTPGKTARDPSKGRMRLLEVCPKCGGCGFKSGPHKLHDGRTFLYWDHVFRRGSIAWMVSGCTIGPIPPPATDEEA